MSKKDAVYLRLLKDQMRCFGNPVEDDAGLLWSGPISAGQAMIRVLAMRPERRGRMPELLRMFDAHDEIVAVLAPHLFDNEATYVVWPMRSEVKLWFHDHYRERQKAVGNVVLAFTAAGVRLPSPCATLADILAENVEQDGEASE